MSFDNYVRSSVDMGSGVGLSQADVMGVGLSRYDHNGDLRCTNTQCNRPYVSPYRSCVLCGGKEHIRYIIDHDDNAVDTPYLDTSSGKRFLQDVADEIHGMEDYGQDGYNQYGMGQDGYNWGGYNEDGYDVDDLDKSGYDVNGYDADGYDVGGFDREGYNRHGYDEDGFSRSDNEDRDRE